MPRPGIEESILRQLYLDEGLTLRAIGQRLGLGETAVRKRLLALGIPLRTRAEAQQKARGLGLSRVVLEQLYWVEGISQSEIAIRLGCSVDAVRDAMRRLDIKRRMPSASARRARGIEIPETELRRRYLEAGESVRTIAQHYQCSETAVRNRLIEYGIERRTPWGSQQVDIGAAELKRLYVDEGYTVEAIAAMYKCSAATVSRQLKRYAVQTRPTSVPKHVRRDFSGDIGEKAYLIGLRLGDLAVFTENKTIVISTSTTREAQLSLVQRCFDPYGSVYVYQGKGGRKHIQCRLTTSFDFLLPKQDHIEDWILVDEAAFFSFLAGYLDAEGCFQTRSTSPRLSVRSYDKQILLQIWTVLLRCGIVAPKPRIVVTAGYMNKAGIVSRKDTWQLAVHRRSALAVLIERLMPLLRHEKRRADAVSVFDKVREMADLTRRRPAP